MVKEDIEKRLIESLNEGQRKSFFEILDFFADPGMDQAFVLKGYAGTGKTYLLKKVVEWVNLTQKKSRIAITAPTNKAVQVLYTLGEFAKTEHEEHVTGLFDIAKTVSSITYSTIHKLLGLKEQITARGEQKFVAQKNDKNEILNYKILIVDETSMLDDSLFKEIIKFYKEVKILFVGDPRQIPPVNRLDCIPFSETPLYNFRRSELTEIMRQKGDNPIIAKSFIIRENVTKVQPIPVLETQLNDSDCGIIYLDSVKDRDKLKPLLNEFFNSEAFKANANYAKVIAWRNKTVNYMNLVVRELLYGKDAPVYVVGEKLITNSPIFANQGPYSGILLNNSEELTILSIEERKTKFYEKSYTLDADIYSIQVEVFDPEDRAMVKKRITVIRDQSLQEYAQLCASVKSKAIQAGIKDIWVTYFNIMKWSADVRYNYALTAHRSQGSSYTNVFLLEEDLDFNRTVVERNRIKYTSYTRPTNKLFILRNNY